MKPISKEQEIVLNLLEKGNVIVDAVAGSGKTTTCLYIAKKFTNKNILLLTYNARLKLETRERIIINNITNMEAHSYHSFCVKYYNKLCFTDKMIKKIIDNGATQLSNYNYDLIIMDEAQDINPLFYALLKKIFKENTAAVAQECVLGDSRQSIYGYNGADSRYLTLANKVLKFNNLSWHFCNLSESFRVSLPICKFINNCMYGKEIMLSKKKGNAPKYIICDTFSFPFIILEALLKKYSPGDIFIIAPSVRYLGGNHVSPIVNLENKIKKEFDDNVLIYVPNNDEERINSEIIKDKLLISSFHQVKGLERKAVVVFSFDDSYFKFYGRDKNKSKCPNEIYVALTRATEVVVLLHSSRLNYLPFLKQTNLIKKYTKFYEKTNINLRENIHSGKNYYSVSMLVRHLSIYQIETAMSFFKIKKINCPFVDIELSHIETFKKSYEEVSNINGIAVPLYYEYKTTGNISLLRDEIKLPDIKKRIDKIICNIKNKELQIADVLYIANCWSAHIGGYVFKTYQIKKYD